MYCPRCGQQQVSDDTRFCSRCGLPVTGLAEWVAGVGAPAVRAEAPQVSSPSPRRKGIRRGAKLMFFGGVMFPIFLMLALIVDEPAPLLIPLMVFFAGLTFMLYSRLFAEDFPTAKGQPAHAHGLGAASAGGALPPGSNLWAQGVGGQPVRTAELVQPPSITEHTTKLLDKE